MKRKYKIILSLIIVFSMVATVFFVMPVGAEDQENTLISSIPNPSGVVFRDIAWNEENYSYAIAVGYTISQFGVIYRYNPKVTADKAWVLISKDSNTTYREIIYDTYSRNGTFYFVGYNHSGGNYSPCAYRINPDFSIVPLNMTDPIPGTKLSGACFDPSRGDSGILIAVGEDGDYGMIATYDAKTHIWTHTDTQKDDFLSSATWNPHSRNIYSWF